MDEIAKLLVGTSPIAAVVLLLGSSIIQVIKEDLKSASIKRDMIIRRLDRIDDKLGLPPLTDVESRAPIR